MGRLLPILAITALLLGGCAAPDTTLRRQVEAQATELALLKATVAPSPTPVPTATATSTPTPTSTPERSVSGLLRAVAQSIVRIQVDDGEGTGFVAFRSGEVLTAFHVVGKASTRPTVIAADGKEYRAVVVGADEALDMALLAVPQLEAPPLTLTEDIDVGDTVVAVGYAIFSSGEPTVTRGILSAKRVMPASGVMLLQTDAPINPGNSGGPLLNEDGQVVGINVMKIVDKARTVENVAFAVSAVDIGKATHALRSGQVRLLATATATSFPTPEAKPRPSEALPVAPARPAPQPTPTPAPAPTLVREYSEQRSDGGVYYVQQWSDGTYTVPVFLRFESLTSPMSRGEVGRVSFATVPGATCRAWLPLLRHTVATVQAGPTGMVDADSRLPDSSTASWTGLVSMPLDVECANLGKGVFDYRGIEIR